MSGKKVQHEKGMTTGSSPHSGANKNGTMTPSDQGNDPTTDNIGYSKKRQQVLTFFRAADVPRENKKAQE